MSKALLIALLVIATSACVPTSYEPLQNQQSDLRSFWQDNISADITQYSCIVCHHEASIANQSDYVLLQSNQEGYLDKNLQITLDYLQLSDQHGQRLLSMSRGLDHASVLNESSQKYMNLQAFVEMATQQDVDRSAAIVFYKENLSSNLVQSQCSLCHVQSGVADATNLILVTSSTPNFQDINANRVIEFVTSSSTNFDNLFLKATGQNHAGGQIIASDSVNAGYITEFLNLLTQQGQQ